MLPYDKFRACEMCGQSGASSQYKTLMLNGVAIPVIVRYCPNCSYTWNELALVAVTAQPTTKFVPV